MSDFVSSPFPQLTAASRSSDDSDSSVSVGATGGLDVWFAILERIVPSKSLPTGGGGGGGGGKGGGGTERRRKREEEATMADAYRCEKKRKAWGMQCRKKFKATLFFLRRLLRSVSQQHIPLKLRVAQERTVVSRVCPF